MAVGEGVVIIDKEGGHQRENGSFKEAITTSGYHHYSKPAKIARVHNSPEVAMIIIKAQVQDARFTLLERV